jgi:hypothetical protein
MKERKREKPNDFRENVRIISQIQATRGRDAEHFIKIFRHEGDNVASATLGTLLGVFEIEDTSEDSKYIVNFLFSVAKNEYFCNPRREVIESFEAALHKINVALAEIVKHGNIRWLGKFHGTIAVLERNTIHLSAAGDGRIYLARNDSLSHISEGLASPEAADRPIKTFIEISSGQLIPGDRLLFLLPKAIEIISEPILERHAGQMNQERLSQFLRTAMINKLERGGAIIVDIEEAPPQSEPSTQTARKTPEKKSSLPNYFSETAFEKQRKESIATALSEEHTRQETSPEPEYTDTKTGHIYVQGDHKELSSEPSRIIQYSESFFYFSQKAIKEGWQELLRLLRSTSLKTKFFWLAATNRTQGTFTLLTKSSVRYLSRKTSPEQASLQKSPESTPLQKASFRPTSFPESVRHTENDRELPAQSESTLAPIPEIRGSRLRSLLRLIRTLSPIALAKARNATSDILGHFRSLFFRLPIKGRIILVLVSFIIPGIFLWSFLSPETLSPASEKTSPTSELTPLPSDSIRSQETRAKDLPLPRVLLRNSDTIASTYIDDDPIIVTRTTVEIPSKQLSIPLPDGIGTPKTVTAMQDLHLLFFLTDTGSLMTISPISRTFASNILPRDSSSVGQIGAYLTYLYTLSADGTTLTRFPRVQGGFGEGTPWFKQDLSPDQNASFALNENVFVFSRSILTRYSRGKIDLTFDAPSVVPDRLVLAVEPENPLLIGLDNTNQRLIVWNTANGHIENQYFSDSLKDATSLALHGQTVLISTPTETLESTLP